MPLPAGGIATARDDAPNPRVGTDRARALGLGSDLGQDAAAGFHPRSCLTGLAHESETTISSALGQFGTRPKATRPTIWVL